MWRMALNKKKNDFPKSLDITWQQHETLLLVLSFFHSKVIITLSMPAKVAAKKVAKKAHAKVAKKVNHKSEAFSSVRKSCSVGTVAIILAGRFRGRRAVILKQLPKNGPLVISGPMKYNGVPIRRIDSRYIIATSTKIDISSVDTSKITAETFKRPKQEKRVKSEGEFMGDKAKKSAEAKAKKTSKAAAKGTVSAERSALQKSVDTALIAAIKKNPQGKELSGYLRSVFTIKAGDKPHRLSW